MRRAEVPRAALLERRAILDISALERDGAWTDRLVERIKRKHDAHASGESEEPPVLDVLVISGGGDRGAFGAGFLRAWGSVEDPAYAKPTFDVVTGVSAGALIAPFAFLGDDASHELVSRLAAAADDGRVLKISTTNTDLGIGQVWDLLEEARRADSEDGFDRFLTILLASNALPGAFPPRIIDGSLHVDGGVTGNILYGQELRRGGFLEVWMDRFPDISPPKIRYWVIFNNKYRPAPQVTRAQWFSVVDRSTTMSTRAATMTAIRHLFALAEIARLRHGADIEVRVVSIPSQWVRPAPGRFNAESMNDMADMGERMGADPGSWSTAPPPH